MPADFSKTCKGCEKLRAEARHDGRPVYRCFADGACRGYIVGNPRFLPYVPAWCPNMIKESEAKSCTS